MSRESDCGGRAEHPPGHRHPHPEGGCHPQPDHHLPSVTPLAQPSGRENHGPYGEDSCSDVTESP